MGAIVGILNLLVENGADELRLASGAPPRMFSRGTPKRLVLPPTAEPILRAMLSPLLTEEQEQQLAAGIRVELVYRPERGEPFQVQVGRRAADGGGGGSILEALFLRGLRGGRPTAGAPTTVAAPTVLPAESPPPERAGPAVGAVIAPRAAPPSSPVLAAPCSSRDSSPPGARLAALLDGARAARASDLHLLDGAPPSVRVDGRLGRLPGIGPLRIEPLLDGLPGDALALAAAGSRALDTILEHDGGRFRLNVYRTAQGLAAAIRILPRSAPSFAELGLPPSLGELALAPHGLVLVAGPTGSGKSATLAALAQHGVQRRAALLVSLEQPIEYLIDPGETAGLVRQRQVGRDVPDFPTGLRDALREDPDLLLVGELRDSETVALALTAAETGHLVLATLHSRSAPSVVERIVDAAGGRREAEVRSQLAASLRAVVSQRLVPRARGGRVVALEVLRGTHNVASLIREGRTAQLATALQAGRKDGMFSLEASLADLVRGGQIERPEAEAAANDLTALSGYLAG